MPNKENIDRLIEAIKAEEIATFNMDNFERQESCGTVACIAGFANILKLGPNKNDEPRSYVEELAEFLNISVNSAFFLSHPGLDWIYEFLNNNKKYVYKGLESLKSGDGQFKNWTKFLQENGVRPFENIR